MNFDLKYIRAGELENYVLSEEYNENNFVPISKSRAKSHAYNPRAGKDDIVLILAYYKEKLSAYLGIIPELLYRGDEQFKVCWLSCMWVLPEYRRSGIAKELLSDAHRIYKGLVFITNYIPRSKAAFFKTGHYTEIKKLRGIRAYLRFDMGTILPRRNQKFKIIKPVLILGDRCLNSLLNIKLLPAPAKKELQYNYDFPDVLDKETGDFIDTMTKDNFFRRSKKEFEWIQKYPWVTNAKDISIPYEKYYFSQYAPDFKQWFIRIRDKSSRIIGFMILTSHKHELKTPYVLSDEKYLPDIFQFIYRLMVREKICTLVCYNNLAKQVAKNKKKFLLTRPSEYGFIATNELKNLLNNNFGEFFDGDGDGVFT